MLHKEELVVKEEDTIRLYNPSVDSDKVQLDMAVEDFQLVWDSIEELYKRESAGIGLKLTKLDKSCVTLCGECVTTTVFPWDYEC